MTFRTGRSRPHPLHGTALLATGVALGFWVTGCAAHTGPVSSAPAPRTTTAVNRNLAASTPRTATSGTATTTGLERDIVLAGRHFKARCDGSGPAIVGVADYGRSMDDLGPALRSVAPHARVCVYDRLGVGGSDGASHEQTFTSMAEDLNGVISGLGLTRPVVVLGDGLGAPIALTWVSRHQQDARAVVLLMPEPPGFRGPGGTLQRLLPAPDPGDLGLSNLRRDLDRFNDPALNRESLDPKSWDAYLRTPPTSTPVFDLIGAPALPWPGSVDAQKVNRAWRNAQDRLLKLSSSAHMISIENQSDWPSVIQRTLQRALQS